MSEAPSQELDRLRARVRELEATVEAQAIRLGNLARAQAEFQAFLDHAPAKIAFKDAQGRYLFVNRRAEIENRYTLEEIRGKLPEEVHYPELARAIRDHDTRVLASGEASSEEVDLVRDGKSMTMLNTRFPLRDADGNIDGIGIVVLDITGRRRMEQQLLRKERLATIGALVGTVAHELRNPLSVITTSLRILHAHASSPSPEEARNLERLERASRRCARIIDELLRFAQMGPLDRKPTEIDGWVDSLLDEMTIPDQVTLERRLASGAATAVDRDHLRGALINLVQNGLDAMRTGSGDGLTGRLTVESRLEGPNIVLAVSDTGIGIEPDKLDNVLEPLFSTKSFGFGLGLPFVKRVTEQHAGQLDIQSTPGEGTTVSLRLPLDGGPGGDS